VFKARSGDFSAPQPLTEAPADARALAEALAARRNDLTQAAISLEPVVGDMLALIAAQPGCLLARMSGSGATCFGLFADATTAQPAAAAVTAAQPGWWIAAAPLLA
jgi:4-diphosphocytidyl-2-C-methyl-D-erythritol kinase